MTNTLIFAGNEKTFNIQILFILKIKFDWVHVKILHDTLLKAT